MEIWKFLQKYEKNSNLITEIPEKHIVTKMLSLTLLNYLILPISWVYF